MKNLSTLLVFALLLSFGYSIDLQAQDNRIRGSQKASTMQHLGADTEITIHYSRPGVKGRTIWGKLVPYGMEKGNKYSDDKPYPWRAGANENTTFETSKDIKIEGETLPAGKYSIHMIPAKRDWTIIFNRNNELWGSYQYNDEKDALRVKVTPEEAPHEEWLRFGFGEITDNSAEAYLHWEKLKVPFKIELMD